MKKYLSLMRTRQWYKNIVVFLALFFSSNMFNSSMIFISLWAFISLCLISSASYIINDLVDLKKDRLHPEKQNRPLASGNISKLKAITVMILLFLSAVFIASLIKINFLYIVLTLFLITQIYTFFLKKIALADVLVIASLFVIRALAGAFAIDVIISPWLILVPFFLALFLAVGKRKGDLHLLGEEAQKTRTSLQGYTYDLTDSLMNISTTLLIISYALYSFLSEYNHLIYTIPFALFIIFQFYYLIQTGSKISRQPEKVIKDKKMIIGMLLWLIVTAVSIYL